MWSVKFGKKLKFWGPRIIAADLFLFGVFSSFTSIFVQNPLLFIIVCTVFAFCVVLILAGFIVTGKVPP
jgi:uncharacterized membrane protein YccC